ncbi:metallophosphoesterase family protein [Rummeliibacillus stabekisii]|uniref:metallophosphoesterase family protein n=1 Tax=Rummeliibacillus stabekisii TaxID=241244 RepID=UPI0011697C05|nr:metallophosphoesterase [Rummeliibacillus stabekisii]MBB5171562.1 ABC-type cobalamin/Fe3+-siderophores transport system ATPase subunit [Rummeliibacillus stabekisii]GEL05530.1 hypothetical protein RST01_21570 [Rummeliibacillus stabekisii]
MKIIHLSDIHFTKNYDANYILNKREEFIKFINSVLVEDKQILFLIAGDIANIGHIKEYKIAEEFFLSIDEELKSKNEDELKIDFVFLPGNHDCELKEENEIVRNSCLMNLKQSPYLIEDDNFKNIIIVQENFESFANHFHQTWKLVESVYENSLANVLKLKIGENFLDLLIMNTSWVTTRKEKPGEMIFYLKYLKEAIDHLENPSIAVMHHPTHWLEPNNKREVEELLNSKVNVIISGHEHSQTEKLAITKNDNVTYWIEGGAFQELHNPDESSEFNLIEFQEEKHNLKISHITFDRMNKIYKNQNIDDENWISYKKNKINSTLVFNEQIESYLLDLGIPLSHPRKKDIILEDLFIFPDIEELIYQNDTQELIRNLKIDRVIEEDRKSTFLISGEKDSGKSTILKTLFKRSYQSGGYPLLVNGENINSSYGFDIQKLIRSNIDRVYSREDYQKYLQLDKDKKILFIDDWHSCNLNGVSKKKFLENANKYFEQIFLFTDSELPFELLLGNNEDEKLQLRKLKILEFGHVKRDEFLKKWILLGQENVIENGRLLNDLDKYKRAMEPILKNGFVPKYPLYIMVVLNSIESQNTHNLDKSSNGYYFEVLIKDSLSNLEIDFNETEKLYQYLTDLSYNIYQLDYGNRITNAEWNNFHNRHLEKYDMDPSQINFEAIKRKLISEKVIRVKENQYEFYYQYVFYFFVAQYFARNISNNKSIEAEVLDLINDIHISQNANILMFLTHLSKDSKIHDSLLTGVEYLLENNPESRLEDDFTFINKLCTQIIIPQISADLDALENRNKLNEDLDRYESSSKDDGPDEEYNDEILEEINRANKAYKMLEVIGQILRNYYGSMEGDIKLELVNQHFSLGLRLNHWLIQQLESISSLLIENISAYIDKKNNVTSEKASKIAKQFVHVMASIITYNNLWKVANSVGTEDLKRTFDRIEKDDASVAKRLINLLIKIEYYSEFPYKDLEIFMKENETNYIVRSIIGEVVRRYLYLNEVNRSDKQRICDIAHIKITKKSIVQNTIKEVNR